MAPTPRRRTRSPRSTKTLALELGQGRHSGSTASTPATSGAARSSGTSESWPSSGASPPQEVYDEIAGETALKYLPHSSEIAGAVLFYASDLSSCVTGTSLPVNSGHFMN